MSRVRGMAVLISVAAALSAETQPAEVTTREETPTFQSSVSLVRVPVVVRDKQGHAVGGLQKQDFQLADRGKAQFIAQFALEGGSVAKPAAAPAAPLEMPGDAGPKLVVPTRFVAYVFDDLHTKAGDLMSVRASALKHIERGIPPEERIALLTLSGRVATEFTDDVEKFRAALMKVMPVMLNRFPPITPYRAFRYRDFSDDGPGSSLAVQTLITRDCLHVNPLTAPAIAQRDLEAAASELYFQDANSLRNLNETVRRLSGMPGDRVMVLVSPGTYVSRELNDKLNKSIDSATRAGVVVNTLDARGVYVINASFELAGCDLRPETVRAVDQSDGAGNLEQTFFLSDLAESTGGSRAAQNDFQAEFDRLALPPDYIYYLGFYPKDLKPDGKFHEIKVTLENGKGLTVMARKGYWAPSHEEDAAATATREIAEAVFSNDEVHDLPISLHARFYKTGAWDARATVITHLDIRHLPLRKQDGRNRDDVTVVCALFDRNGNFVKGKQTQVELRLKDEHVESRRARGVTVNHEFDVKSGSYLIRVVARDAEGRQTAAASGVVEIP